MSNGRLSEPKYHFAGLIMFIRRLYVLVFRSKENVYGGDLNVRILSMETQHRLARRKKISRHSQIFVVTN